jgi:hypothetical protein
VGKEILSFSLALEIFSFTEKKNNPSTNTIELGYHETQPQIISSSENQPFPPTFVENTENILFKLIRKKPLTKKIIFLWEI